MFKKLSRTDALEEISTWTNNDVLCLLQKNGLENCCKTIAKRQIDGDELLHLTEGKLALWKSDLTRPLIWSLWAFIEEIRRSPEKFVEEKFVVTQVDDHLSDTGSWGTDFEDEGNEDSALSVTQKGQSNPESKPDPKNLQSTAEKLKDGSTGGISKLDEEDEGTYANCGPIQEYENTYANFQEPRILPPKNVSRLHSQAEKSLSEQLKEQLKLMNTKRPTMGLKPEPLRAKKPEAKNAGHGQPQKSFLYTDPKPTPKPKPNVPSQMQS